jgi:hypothetical protein
MIWKYTDETETAVSHVFPDGRGESGGVSCQFAQDYLAGGGVIAPAFTLEEIAAREAERQAIADRRANIVNKLSGLTDSQIDAYIDANVNNLAGAVAYLKRLTKAVRALAIEAGVKP